MAEPCKLITHGVPDSSNGASATYKWVTKCETHGVVMECLPSSGLCPEGKFEDLEERIERLEHFLVFP